MHLVDYTNYDNLEMLIKHFVSYKNCRLVCFVHVGDRFEFCSELLYI